MKKFKGTPGPWSINHYYNWIESENADKVVIGGSQGSIHDDAQLIAAAPELLEALQKMVSKAYKQNWNDAYPEEIQSAQAAINKALGEKQ